MVYALHDRCWCKVHSPASLRRGIEVRSGNPFAPRHCAVSRPMAGLTTLQTCPSTVGCLRSLRCGGCSSIARSVDRLDRGFLPLAAGNCARRAVMPWLPTLVAHRLRGSRMVSCAGCGSSRWVLGLRACPCTTVLQRCRQIFNTQ